MTYNVFGGTLNLTQSIKQFCLHIYLHIHDVMNIGSLLENTCLMCVCCKSYYM